MRITGLAHVVTCVRLSTLSLFHLFEPALWQLTRLTPAERETCARERGKGAHSSDKRALFRGYDRRTDGRGEREKKNEEDGDSSLVGKERKAKTRKYVHTHCQNLGRGPTVAAAG